METPIKMDDLGIPLFSETATSSQVLLTWPFFVLFVDVMIVDWQNVEFKYLDGSF